MNTHKHARLTYARRIETVRRMTFEGISFTQAAASADPNAPQTLPDAASSPHLIR